MNAEDADQFLAALVAHTEDAVPSLSTICRRASRLLHMRGASVVLMNDGTLSSVASAYGVPVIVQDLEFTLGEGPASDAYTEGRPVFVDKLTSFTSRWPQFARALVETEIRSVYALPLQLGAIKLGVLVLYSDRPGALKGDGLSAAVLVADLVTDQVLAIQAGAAPEVLAWGIAVDDDRAVVHQATGMISAQRDCTIGEAIVRLRAYAFAAERPIDQVGADVVAGRLRFDRP
ncbi:MAG TPA: GAF and ANTAR domain-containing protein [Acidimicrobiales bacterium]|nr:GAF and ANTAR domain-containing protein [Acidimicrobiales bacterium]